MPIPAELRHALSLVRQANTEIVNTLRDLSTVAPPVYAAYLKGISHFQEEAALLIDKMLAEEPVSVS